MSRSRCWAEISHQNLIFNIRQMRKYIPDNIGLLAIVKANSYGHGAVQISKWLAEEGVVDLGVACVTEAAEIRMNEVKSNILILSYVDREDWKQACDLKCRMSVTSFEHGAELNEWGRKNNRRVDVEVKVDTGMRRLGVDAEADERDIVELYSHPYLNILGTYTHLCRADSFEENDRDFTIVQKERFDRFINVVRNNGLCTGRTHMAASSAMLNYFDYQYDFCRPGFVVYGYDVGEVHHSYEYRPILSLYAKVEQVKDLKPGEGTSYGHIFKAERPMKIAIVSCGFADGYVRALSNKCEVLIHGRRARQVGRICMDQMMVDVTDIENVQREDLVTLIGTDGNETILINELADILETSPSETACLITARVPRFYVD